LTYWGVTGSHPVDSLHDGDHLSTLLAGQSIAVQGNGAEAALKGSGNTSVAHIVDPDVTATNGLVQGLDQILVPQGITLPAS
jgi:hypothetical protein